MHTREFRYEHVKRAPKRARQGLFRFSLYGALLVAGEVAFYTITKVGRSIPYVRALFQYRWEVDSRLELYRIWDAPIHTFFGQASLYMFLVYGSICLFGLEPAHRALRRKDVPILLRGIVYMFVILAMECALGWVLRFATGYDIWIYRGPGTIFTYTSWAIAPMWFICGLIAETVARVFDSLAAAKLSLYGLEGFRAPDGPRDRIAFVSDVHVGPRNEDGSPVGWFYGVHEIHLTVILQKIAMDRRIRELVILGDFFDTWLYPPERRPESVGEIVARWADSPFVEPLRACVRRCDAVWYLPGNHDMQINESDLDAFSSGGKRIKLTTPEAFNGRGLLACGTALHAEHGNAGDFFNAPDEDGDSVQGLPVGYYIARISASTEGFRVQDAFAAAYARVLSSRLREKAGETADHRAGRLFIRFFVDAVVAIANSKRADDDRIGNATVIRMPDGYRDVTVAEVKTRYSSLLSAWLAGNKTYLFASVGRNGLRRYARSFFGERDWKLWFKRLFQNPARPDLVVVMGHTHDSLVERVLDRERQGIYANSGCVCANTKGSGPTWVEVRDGARSCSVRVRGV